MASLGSACDRNERPRADAVRAVRGRIEGRFQPPPDGRLTDAQIDMYVRARHESASQSDALAARRIGTIPGEFDWVRARIAEALLALDSRQANSAALESYNRALAVLREARRGAPAAAAARVDVQIAALERERESLKRPDPLLAVVAANAGRVERRRAEIESAGP